MSGQIGGFSPIGGGAPLGMDFDDDTLVGLLLRLAQPAPLSITRVNTGQVELVRSIIQTVEAEER